jgi:hypothetical protein
VSERRLTSSLVAGQDSGEAPDGDRDDVNFNYKVSRMDRPHSVSDRNRRMTDGDH